MARFDVFIFLLLLTGHNSKGQVTTPVDPVIKKDSVEKEVAYPYAINYSAEFESIDPQKGNRYLTSGKTLMPIILINGKINLQTLWRCGFQI